MNSMIFISRPAELLVKYMRKEITEEERKELDQLITADEGIRKLFDSVNDPEYMRQQLEIMAQIDEQTDHKKNLQKFVDAGVMKSDEVIFTHVKLNGDLSKDDQYEPCIRMLLTDLAIEGFKFIMKTERGKNWLAYHLMFDEYLLESEFTRIIHSWDLLLKGMALPIDRNIELHRITRTGLETVSTTITHYR